MDVREGTTGGDSSHPAHHLAYGSSSTRDTELRSAGTNVIGTMGKVTGGEEGGGGGEDEGRVIRHLPFHYSCFAGETAARHAIARSILPVFVRATDELGKIASHYAHVDHASLKHRRG